MFFTNGLFAQTDRSNNKDYLIIVSNSKDKAELILDKMKKEYEDAGMYYNNDSGQYYVFIERYYVESGADYAVWWHKKENRDLPKIWAKAVPLETGAK